MPTETTHRVGAFDYRFGSEIRMYRSPSSFARTVSDIRLRCQQESVESVVVCAPEMPAALTAIAVEPLTPAWTTWHAYPGTSEIVRTWSSLTPAS